MTGHTMRAAFSPPVMASDQPERSILTSHLPLTGLTLPPETSQDGAYWFVAVTGVFLR
jgi:hypothetical protein